MRSAHRFSFPILMVAIACSPDATGPREATKAPSAHSGALGWGSIAAAGGVYDASIGTLPQAQGWTYNPGLSGNPPPTVSGGLLMENVTNGGTYWNKIEPSIDFAQDYVMEVVLHVISSNHLVFPTGSREGYYIDAVDKNTKRYEIGIADSGWALNSDNITPHQLTPFPFYDGKFHTLRFAVHANSGSFWIDQSLQASGLSSFNFGSSAGRVLFGGAAFASRSVTELKSACYGTSSTDCRTDLALSITPPLPTFTLNQPAVVTFRDSNIGARPSTSATLFVPATPGFKFVSATNATCGAAPGGLSCALGGVAAGGQLNFSLTVKPVQIGTFPVTLTLKGQETDGNTANNVIVRNVTVH